jgi:hypothetical protein
MPIDVRRELNDGLDFTLVDGLHRLRAECLDRVRPDTIIVFDTHWFTTFEHVVSGHDRRTGIYTSDELPRGMSQMPYDFIQGNLMEYHHCEYKTLFVCQVFSNYIQNNSLNLSLQGCSFRSNFPGLILHHLFKKVALLRGGKLVQGNSLPPLMTSDHHCHIDGEFVRPGGKFAVTTEIRKMFHQGDQSVLRTIFGQLQDLIPASPSKVAQIAAEKIKGSTQ